MSNRFEEIDKFLKAIAEKEANKGEKINEEQKPNLKAIAKKRAEKKAKKDEIYKELSVWNIPESDRVFDFKDIYIYDNAGIDYMSGASNEEWFKRIGFFNTFLLYNIGNYTITDYFNKVGKNNFLRFYNPEATTDGNLNKVEPIKMYVSLGKNDSFYFLYSLMKYCDENRILHNSKLAGSIRNDDVVLRVHSLNDAEKIADFINNNEFELNNPNPFCLTDGKIGYAMDSGESYNEYVAITIQEYISILDDKTKAGYEGFKEYVESLENNDVKLLSLKLALDSSKTIQDFYKAWNKTINPNDYKANTDEGLEKQKEYEIIKKQERLKNKDNSEVEEERITASKRRDDLQEKFKLMRSINKGTYKSESFIEELENTLNYISIVPETKKEFEARKKKEVEAELKRKEMIKNRLQNSEMVAYMDELAKNDVQKNGESSFSKSVQKFRDEYDLEK